MKISGFLNGQTEAGVISKFEKMGFEVRDDAISTLGIIMERISSDTIERVRIKADSAQTFNGLKWVWNGSSKKSGIWFECWELPNRGVA